MKLKKYKLILILAIAAFAISPAYSYVEVKIKPTQKITTANPNLQEGDIVNFVIEKDVFVNNKITIKKDSPVKGLITYIEPNEFGGQNAKITIEQFETVDVNNKKIKLTGSVFRNGNAHAGVLEFISIELIRGGEVQISPRKDSFKLFLKENI